MPGWPIKFSAAWSYVPGVAAHELGGHWTGRRVRRVFPARSDRAPGAGRSDRGQGMGQGSVPAARDRQRVMRKAGSAAFASAPATIFPRRRGAWTRATAKDTCIPVA
jgi:hypothetical protein